MGLGNIPIEAVAWGYAEVSEMPRASGYVQDNWEGDNRGLVLVPDLWGWFLGKASEKCVTAIFSRKSKKGGEK